MKHRLEYLLLKAAMDLLASLEAPSRLRWGRALGRLWYRLDGRHRRLAVENITRGLELDRPKAAWMALRNFEHIGMNLAEFAAFTRFEELSSKVSIEGIRHLEGALAEGRGAFIATGHIGNWELGGAVLSGIFPVTAVARLMKNPLSEKLIDGRRRAAGTRVIGHRNSTKPILQLIGRGEAVGMLLDHNTSHREAVFVPFMGRPASVNFGLALLASRTGSPVVPVFDVREDGGRHRTVIAPPLRMEKFRDRQEEIGINTARITAVIEAHVRRYPDQWFWVHNRWKNQPRTGQKVYRP